MPNANFFGASKGLTVYDQHLCENLQKLWLDESTADIHFVIDIDQNQSQVIPAHKCILAVDSSVFYRRFFVDLKNESHIEICDVKVDVFETFISSFYRPKINITDQNVDDLIDLAKLYKARGCMAQCEQFLKEKLTPENVIYAFQLTIDCNDMEMYILCLRFIEKNLCRVLTTDGFLFCSHNVLEHILMSNIQNRDEFMIFEACMHWAKTSLKRQNIENSKMIDWRMELGKCFELIRFGAMTPLQFMKCETIYPIFNFKELNDIKLRIISMSNDI